MPHLRMTTFRDRPISFAPIESHILPSVGQTSAAVPVLGRGQHRERRPHMSPHVRGRPSASAEALATFEAVQQHFQAKPEATSEVELVERALDTY